MLEIQVYIQKKIMHQKEHNTFFSFREKHNKSWRKTTEVQEN